ncbi:MAG TPA: HAMP domain-containing sensor histidine kinase [Gammaproteobacteria bacterium]|nr:HAMP domain-containing sensor histidine kinase [Gammaproteobacteria bacterium]
MRGPGPLAVIATTAGKLALRYALLCLVITAAGLAILYWATSTYIDARLRDELTTEAAALARTYRREGRQTVVRTLRGRAAGHSGARRLYRLEGPGGERLAGTIRAWPNDLPADARVRNVWISAATAPARIARDGYWPMVGIAMADGSRLLVAQPMARIEELQEFILGTMAGILLLTLAVALALAYYLGRAILARIEPVNATARAVRTGQLGARVPGSGRGDEFDELGNHLNRMLDRIEALLRGMRQVSDDIAHDLRRPLSRLRNRLENAAGGNAEVRESEELAHCLDDVDELIGTLNALLEIAQAEAGTRRDEADALDLSTLCLEVGELYVDAAEDRHQRLDLDVSPGIEVSGLRHLLSRTLTNLLDNALKYTPAGGTIALSLAACGDHRCRLMVSDNGPGIPPGERDRVMQRFVRLDSARARPGSGLGLSLVDAAVRLHDGTLTLGDARPGLTVTVDLPRRPSVPLTGSRA